jgi:hypothetical protein
MRRIILFAIIVLLLAGCAGTDKTGKDKIPPTKPIFYSHIGDMGDEGLLPGTYLDGVDGNELNDYNNGIDAVHGESDYIRLQWQHLIDNDLDYIDIYRYSFYDEPVRIAQILSSYDSYIDTTPDLFQEYKYYLEVFDEAGNSTVSDTVSYKLYEKAQLLNPLNNATVNDLHDLSFRWAQIGNGELVAFYRIVLYKDISTPNYEENELVWSFNDSVIGQEVFEIDYTTVGGSVNIPNGEYYWRVDAFMYNSENDVYYGSESVAYRIQIYQ